MSDVARTEITVTINRPPEDVFAVLSDVRNVPLWSPNTIEERMLTEGPMGVGSRRVAVIKSFGGRTMENEAEMVGFEPDRKMVVKSVRSPVPFLITIDFEPMDGDTRLRWTADIHPGRLLRPIGPLMAALYRRLFRRDLQRLRDLMNAGEL